MNKKTRQSSGLVFRHSVLLVHRLLLMLCRKMFPQNHSKPEFLVSKKPARSVPTFLLLLRVPAYLDPHPLEFSSEKQKPLEFVDGTLSTTLLQNTNCIFQALSKIFVFVVA